MSSNKVFVIGLDGMDPSLTKKYMDQGKMPNVKKLVDGRRLPRRFSDVGRSPNGNTANVDHTGYRRQPGHSRHHLFLESGSGQSGHHYV